MSSMNTFRTQYPEVDQLIIELCINLQRALPSLKGLYLFGSLVGGDFNPRTSDIDLVAIVEGVISTEELACLKAVHRAFSETHTEWDNRIEVAYVSVDGMRHFKTKTNRIARISPGEPLHYRDMDIEWLMDWYMVQEQGMVVFGPEPKDYIPHISQEEFVQSLKNALPSFAEAAQGARWIGYQAYIVMAFCRNLYAIKYGNQVSKYEGARWAAKEYPEWSEFITEAASWHGSSDRADRPDTHQKTLRFVQFAISEANKGEV